MTDYLKLAQESAAPAAPDAAANPYLSLVDEDRKAQEARTRTVLETALRDKPDAAAERQRLAVTSGLPLRVVERNLDDVRVKEQARAIDLLRMAQDSPILARQLVDPQFTTLAVDDLPTLSKIEKAVGNATRYVMGAGQSNPVTDAGNAAADLALGATVGVGKAIFDIAAVLNDALGLDGLAASARGAAKRAGESMEAYGSTPESSTGSAVKAGLQSAGTNLAVLPIGLERSLYATASRAATTVAALMGTAVGAGAYNEARDAGKNKVESAAFGIPQGVFEFVFEKIPAQKLFGDLANNAGLMKTLQSQAISEGWTEQLTTLAQDFNEWMNLHPEKTAAEFIAERPDAAYQTFIATLVGVGVQTTTIRGVNKIVEKATDQRLQFQQDAFEELQKMAASSALRERSPKQFRALVQQVVDTNDTAQKSIHVDAQVLNQLGPEALALLPESVRAQIEAEAAKNGTVEIPLADVLTVAPGTPLEQVLNDHARMTPDSMSRADALAAGDQAQVLKQEAEKIIQQARDQQAAQADYDQVQQNYARQIVASGRYRPAVAEQMGHWLASFYTAYGARTGMTATEMQARYPVRVLGAAPAAADPGGADRLEQVVYHGSPHTFEAFSLDALGTGEGAQVYGWGLYFAENREVAKGYHRRLSGEGQGGVYSVDIPDGDIEKMLLWDAPLAKQPAAVKTALTTLGVPLKVFNVVDASGSVLTSQESREKARLYIRRENVAGKVVEADSDLTGERAYKLLKLKHGSDKAASEALDAAGIPGLRYLDGGSRANADGTRNAVVWNQKTLDAMNAQVQRTLEQRTAESVPRGTFNPATLDLVLNPNANLSTFFHETGHFFLEVMADIASQPNAPAQVVEDMATFLKWAGIKGDESLPSAPVGALPTQPVPDGLVVGANALRDLLDAQPAGAQGSDLVSAEPFIGVFSKVARAVNDPQVLNAVVAALPVDVMNVLASQQLAPEVLLKDGAMLQNAFAVAGDGDVTVRLDVARQVLALVEVVADRAAEAAGVANTGGTAGEGGAAIGAFERSHGGQVYSALEKWNRMPLDEKRPFHERWAESVEVYVMEGRAPSVELQPLMRRFATWLKSVYGSIKAFLASRGVATGAGGEPLAQDPTAPAGPQMALNDDIRRVMDRMLATDAQITEANEVAGLLPDLEADAEAMERLNKRSMADLKWAVRARDAVIVKLRKQARGIEKAIRADVTAEVNAMPEVQAKGMLAKTQKENGGTLNDTERTIIADAFGYESVDAMAQAIDAFGNKADVIDGMTQQRMLQEHGDLTDEAAIREAANEAVHNEARARSLATELRTQSEMLNPRQDTGEVNAKGSQITVNALVEAAKQFAANVVASTPLRDLKSKAWQHTAAERRAGQRWQAATAAGKTQEAVQAKQDQMLNNAAAKAAIDAKAEMGKILEFFKRVTKGNDEKVVEKGRDPDIVNAARAVLAAYGIETQASKGAAEYLEIVERNDPETHAVIAPMAQGALQNAQPIEALTFNELQALHEEIRSMWFLAKRSRQMEIDGDLLDRADLAQELRARMEEIGIPDRVPGEGKAVTKTEERALFLRQGISFVRRVEQWAEGFDGRYGGPFLRYVFQPVKAAADRYRADRTAYRKKLQALVDNIAPIVGDQIIKAPELGYEFGTPGSAKGTAMNEVLHAIAHTGNDSNKRKLLLGRGWATENPDGTLDTRKWDSFIARLVAEGKLEQAHFDFVQGVWDLLEETKPLAQKAHRDAFGRYFAEVTADTFVDPFGVQRRGGYVPAIVDPEQVKDNELRKLAEAENESMAFAFPAPGKGFTKSRVDSYTRPLLLDLRTLSQHLDKVLLFSHMTGPARDVRKLISDKKVGQPLARIDPSVASSMLQPWLQRSAQQVVETPIVGAGKWARVPSIIRARAGAALMFANVSNALQQVTGLSTALVKVGPGHMMRAMAQHVAHPVKAAKAVWDASSYMDDRAKNEVAVMNEQLQDILLNPSVYEKAQAWSMRNAYFLQTAVDNALSPIVWTGAYNQAMTEGMSHDDAVRFADGTVRQTQGSTLPEDVSRFETGPAYARAFTQFIGYFNMVANTNATALKQIAGEVGLKKGAGRALGVVMVGLLVPMWVAEAIAQAFKGGPDDEDKDGYLDDWLAAVFGFGTARGLLAMIPIAGQAANSAVTRLDNNPMNDRISLSPGLSLLESALGGNVQTVHEILSDSKEVNARRAVRDAATLVSVFTGLPAYAAARPVGYLAGVADDKIQPTGAVDVARGLITGTASPESKVK